MRINELPRLPGTTWPRVELLPFGPQHLDMVWEWMNPPQVRCWLDFGGGRQDLSKRQLYLMLSNSHVCARLFQLPGDSRPLGLVCMNNIDDLMGSMDVWIVRDLSVMRPIRNSVTSAGARILATGFLDFGRQIATTWVVASNRASIYLHDIIGMRHSGTQRSRHVIDGRRHDRWLYDMTLAEFGQLYPDVPSEQGRTFRTHFMRTLPDDGGLEVTHG
ncbi:GNAT family N-acetyltransferase [Hyalangium versicolor]|uniref:GNAT family N-acetyltransferase n=1 Tax=Hyalangium versicolor TaxID=2861190 RepID=UPI001CCB6AD6|nr:GNAT family N-acetyltransferase [Hyalangium versicolor]